MTGRLNPIMCCSMEVVISYVITYSHAQHVLYATCTLKRCIVVYCIVVCCRLFDTYFIGPSLNQLLYMGCVYLIGIAC